MTDYLDYVSREWRNKDFKSKALEFLGFGLVSIPVLCVVRYAVNAIGSAMDLTESQTLVDIIKDPTTYVMAAGLSMGRISFYEIACRLNKRKKQKRKEDISDCF